jgi:hypothetical protein
MVACAGCGAAQGTDTTAPPAGLSIQGNAQAADGSPVAGVAVCLRPDPGTTNQTTCTTSDRQGAWKLVGLPTSAMVAITFVKAGFLSTLRPIATETSDLTIADGALIGSADLVGALVDESKGAVAFSTALPGTRPATAATVSLRDFDGREVAPVYFDRGGAPAPGATAGTSGVFANLVPSYYVLTFYGASVECSTGGGLYGYPVTLYTAQGQARLLVPVVAGFVTASLAATCSAGSGS